MNNSRTINNNLHFNRRNHFPGYLFAILAIFLTNNPIFGQTTPESKASSHAVRPISSESQPTSHYAQPDMGYLNNKSGKWSVVTNIYPEAGAQPLVIPGLVAERSMIGQYCLHEIMQPGPGSKIPSFLRYSDLAYNLNERRWDYISIDSRVTVGIMYFTYLSSNKDSIVSFIPSFSHPGIGPDLKNRGLAVHARSVIVNIDQDHDLAKIYFRLTDQSEWLFMQYEYTRIRDTK